MIKISIIVPCYNTGKYIKRCYNSLLIQKDADDVEFIFVNDGSTDNTLSILQNIGREDHRIVVIDQKNAGVSAARNAALEIAKGEYVYLLDGDDYLTKDAIFEIKQILRYHKTDIVISAYNSSRNNKETFRPLPFKEGLYNINDFWTSISYFPTAPQLVYRMDIIKNENIRFDSSLKCGEVYAFTVKCMRYMDTIYVLNKPTFNYYQRTDSAVHAPNYSNDITVVNALSSIYKDGESLSNYSSFAITAFKLMCAFSYNKYLKYSTDFKAVETIEYILSHNIIKRCIKDVLLKPHKFTKERLMALYMLLMPKKYGFQLINMLLKKKI